MGFMTRAIDSLKQALHIRLAAFQFYNHTRIPLEYRYNFLVTAGVTSIMLALFGPDIQSLDLKDKAQFTSAPMPQLTPFADLTRLDIGLEPEFTPPEMVTKIITLKSGDNLGPLLQKAGLSGQEAHKVTTAFATVFKPRHLRVGHQFNLKFNDDSLEHLIFKPDVEKTIMIDRADDIYTAREIMAEFRYETLSIAAKVDNSLYVDATRLGAPERVVAQFANIYEYSVDFQRDIQPGDNFEMFFEVARARNGEIIKSGDLLYTSFSPRGKETRYWLFEDDKGRENFYDAAGKTAKRKLRATPVNGARLSSSFGRRKHPILGYRRMHAGVDFAAPTGTPILAAGSGTVERANRYGGYGNYIRIRHTDGYKTAYAHLSKFARGVKAGKYVKQDQVIGYVGSTGRSTGPHLHYEVHHHGKKINPRRLSQLSGKPIAKSDLPKFQNRRAQIDALREQSVVITGYPDADQIALGQTGQQAELNPKTASQNLSQAGSPAVLNSGSANTAIAQGSSALSRSGLAALGVSASNASE